MKYFVLFLCRNNTSRCRYSQETRHLHEPAHVTGVDQMFDGPLGQFVPFVPGAPVDGEPQLHVLVLALLQVCDHLLRKRRHKNRQQGASAPHVLHTPVAKAALGIRVSTLMM